MRRRPLYSRSGKLRTGTSSPWVAPDGISPVYVDQPAELTGPSLRQRAITAWSGLYQRHPGKVLVTASALVTLAVVGLYDLTRPTPQDLSQETSTRR